MAGLWIGTSGYSYKDWGRGTFYPRGLAAGEWFDFYQKRFPIVELNVTFYRLPSAETFRNWHKKSRRGFRFFVKGSRYLTHLKRLKDPRAGLRRFYSQALLLKEKLEGILWQLPPGFKKDTGRLRDFLTGLEEFRRVPTVWEFRDESWFSEDVAALLKEFGAVFCRADKPEFTDRIQVPDTAPFLYVRRHGPRAGLKYALSYPDSALRRDARQIRQWLGAGKTVYVFFNNDVGGAAVRDAARLQAMLSPPPS